MISFIVPLRDRLELLKSLVKNLEENFTDFELIIAYQDDNLLFKRGQLMNLGFQKSKGDVCIFQDVDIRHLKRIDFSAEIGKWKANKRSSPKKTNAREEAKTARDLWD